MYASVSSSRAIEDYYFEVAQRIARDGERRIDMHVSTGLYVALNPDEARRLYGALGRVLADVDAEENTAAGLCPDGCCDLPTTTSTPDVDEETCRG